MVLAAAMITTFLFGCVVVGFLVHSMRKDLRRNSAAATQNTTGETKP